MAVLDLQADVLVQKQRLQFAIKSERIQTAQRERAKAAEGLSGRGCEPMHQRG